MATANKPKASLLDQTPPPGAPSPDATKKANQTVRFEHDTVGRSLSWHFDTMPGAPSVAYVYRKPFDGETPCDHQLYVHGVKQKIGDGAAKSADPKTGRTSEQVKLAAMTAIADSLRAGVFNRIGGGATGPALATVADLAQAICTARGKTDIAGMRALVESWSADARANMQAKPDIATALIAIVRSRMPQGATDDAEAGLDGVA